MCVCIISIQAGRYEVFLHMHMCASSIWIATRSELRWMLHTSPRLGYARATLMTSISNMTHYEARDKSKFNLKVFI